MSGTSLDGLDICYASFTETNNQWSFEILRAETFPYSKEWEDALKTAIHLSSEDLAALNSKYGFYLGEVVQQFILKHHIKKIDLIASHGHTVFHQPERKFTLQIGDGRAINLLTGIPVVYDFRMQDVLLGGNGAPLVPIGDHHLFSDYEACLNIGGFSNISFHKNNQRIAFDICPVNILLNPLAQQLGKKYDESGDIARNSTIDHDLLNQLNCLKFYQASAPKSLGIEWVIKNIQPLIEHQTPENLLATFTEHAAQQISNTLTENQLSSVLFTGGGAYNQFLMERISKHTHLESPQQDHTIIDFKEALIFAFMGVLRTLNRINILSSVTGASRDHSSGLICN